MYIRLSLLTIFLAMGYLVGSAAWNSVGNVSVGDSLTIQRWNDLVWNVNDLNGRTSSISCPTGQFVSGFTSTGGLICNNVFNTIVSNGSGKKWSDGTYATSCRMYRLPTGNYIYSGLTGDGIYTIDPDGAWATAPFDIYCDMTSDGWGWTLVVGIDGANTNHNSASSVTPGNLVSIAGKWKLSDAVINQIRWATGTEWIVRLTCGSSDYFDYRSTVWHADYSGYPNGVGWDVYTQPWWTAPGSWGGSAYPNQPGPWSYTTWGNVLIYGYSGWLGCHNGVATGSAGTTWIR